ncbi:MAG: biopolymer transporter ExbD [Saprospiraceae bacterium]|nr:biopolymer transporter ExbD [Saprospiraceae bacterium]MCW5923715.1 biopolymer transporter ExbD [Saprospiraceae bacterium]
MAEMQVADKGGKKGGKKRAKKMSTRVDLTPMVDLAFLLITFFMLTTTLAKPQIMALVMPEKDVKKEDVEPVKESKVLTLLLGANDKVYWYEGITDAKLDSTGYGAEGLRKVILDKMEKVRQQFGMEDYEDFKTKEPRKGSFLNVIIKPTEEARYKNLVDALDEMAICKVRYYVILDVSDLEKDFIKNPAAGLKFDVEEQIQAATGGK